MTTSTVTIHSHNIDQNKLDKYLPKLMNGDLKKLESFLPNLLAHSIIEREVYDYRTTQLRRHDPQTYNTKLAAIKLKIQQMKQKEANHAIEMEHEVQELMATFNALKLSINLYHEKHSQPPLIS